MHNVYTGITVDVPPFTSIGLHHVDSDWEYNQRTFIYDLISPKLKKIAIAHPPTKFCGFEDYELIAVFDKRIAITGRCGVTHSLTWYMLATPYLTTSRYEDAAYHGGRYFAVTDNGTCYMWDPHDGGIYGVYIYHGVSYLLHCWVHYLVRYCIVSIAGSMQPPLLIRAPQVVEDIVPQNAWHNWMQQWYLIPNFHGYGSVGTMLLVRFATDEVTGNEPAIPYLNRTIRCYKKASCVFFSIDASQRDLRGAEWEAISDLGRYSIFLGESYPRVMEIPPMHTSGDGLPFIKPGCVFIARRRIADWAAPAPDLCRFSLDGSAMLGCTLPSCYSRQQSAPMWIVSSLRNFDDWNVDEENA